MTEEEKITVDEKEIEDFLKLLLAGCAMIDVKSKFNATPDSGDNAVLATAHDGKADYIVSGDTHLLNLNTFRIKIVTANEMLKIMQRSK